MARAKQCKCGRNWVPVYYGNSGTTEIRLACPVVREAWGDDPYVWRRTVRGHQFVITTTPEHQATGCCNIWEVHNRP